MLEKHFVYVAEKTQRDYARSVRRACEHQSWLECLIGGIFRALRQALDRVAFDDPPAAAGRERVQSS